MIPIFYAATTVASIWRIPPDSESAGLKKQRAANDKIVQGLTEPGKAAYLAEVRKVQAKIKGDFQALPPKEREKKCAAIR